MSVARWQTDSPRTAIVLSGGGARGAYQVGALAGLLEIGVLGSSGGIDILVGSSAGAINAGALAARADDLATAVQRLEEVWATLGPEQVYYTDFVSLSRIGARWIRDLSFGGIFQRVSAKSLLDTAPLRAFLTESIPVGRIGEQVSGGALGALAITATNLYTANGVIFLEGATDVPLWRRGRWNVERARIGIDHLLASSAIPVFFPSVEIDGRHFGDGCIRNTAPLSPAINLGADRIVAIGVREPGGVASDAEQGRQPVPPTLAQITGVLLDAVMLDAIEADVEHSGKVNTSVLARPGRTPQDPFRWVDVLWLSPSRSFRDLAGELGARVPAILRYLLRGLGSDEATKEIVSYLLFDREYCGRLIALGRADVAARAEEIRAFFAGERVGPA